MPLPRDVVVGALILVLSAFLWFVTTTFDTDPLGMTQGMPATHMPRLVLAVIAVLTVVMMVQSVLERGETLGGLPPWQMPATAALLALAAGLFTTLGVPIVFFGVCLSLPILWGARRFFRIVIFAIAVPTAIYIVFKLVLGLRLPMGPLAAAGL